MTKYLLLFFGLVVFVWWIWRKLGSARKPTRHQADRIEAEPMVQCAHCGVNQPISESIFANDRYYCCPAHLPSDRSDGA